MRKYRNVTTIPENRKLFGIWSHMIRRCTDSTCDRYSDYGGRGIIVSNEWMSDFDNFADWSHENGYEIGLTIDRINNDGNYEPSNCRWVTRREQNRNKRTNKIVCYRGESKPLIEWCEQLGLRYDAIHNRIEKGWSVEEAFEVPLASTYKSFEQICREHGVSGRLVRDRTIRLGWDMERALNTPAMKRGQNGYLDGLRDEHRKCLFCGNNYRVHQGGQRYCSAECREQAKKIRRRTHVA